MAGARLGAGSIGHTGRRGAAGILYYAAWFPWMERVNVEWAYEQGSGSTG